jgi:hypothetical protein
LELLLQNNFVAGRTLRYRGTTRVRQEMVEHAFPRAVDQAAPQAQSGPEHVWHAIMLQEVLTVDADGAAHVITRAALEQAEPAATEASLEAQRSVSYAKIDRRGRILASSATGPTATYVLPETPISVDGTWSDEGLFPLPPGGQTAPVNLDYRLIAFEERQGRNCAIIDVNGASREWEVSLPDTDEPALAAVRIEGSLCFCVDVGLLISSDVVTRTSVRVGRQVVTSETHVQQVLERVTTDGKTEW